MDVLNYLNSKDVRQHLKNIGYRFAPLDAAKVIENCEHISFDEKQEAFLELIAETNDVTVTIPEGDLCSEKATETTLHTMLKSYIEDQKDALKYFKRIEEGCVYMTEITDDPIPFICTDFKKELLRFLQSDSNGKICFTKKNLTTDSETSVGYDKCGRLLWVHDLDRFVIPYNLLCLDFNFSEAVPSPFEIGDLVIACGKYKVSPFVITKMDEECIRGYSLHNGRLLESERYLTAADIEYYPEKDAPILKVVSDYIKGKSELHTFINMYHKSALEGYAAMLG